MINNYEIKELEYEKLKYALGALLYCPADNEGVVDKIINKQYENIPIIIFCLEDSILEENLEKATISLKNKLDKLLEYQTNSVDANLPLFVIRIRTPKHLEETLKWVHPKYQSIISGFVLPKYDSSVSAEYKKIINNVNNEKHNYYFLPILESKVFTDALLRRKELAITKEEIRNTKGILGILVGTNDMCNIYGIRRNVKQTIYDIGVIRDALSDIISTFSNEYVVNGAIWEYFDGEGWKEGLIREFELDKLNGLIGKSCIHPKQVEVVLESMKVDKQDYFEAMEILNWNIKNGVSKGNATGRMNEIATHKIWANKIKILSEIYGIKE